MTPERWRQLKTLFGRALELETGERSAFIAQSTPSDPELQSSLRSLIAHHDAALTLLEGPMLSQERITEYLAVGVRTFREGEVVAGRFRIDGFLGEGGMGEVYRAHDLELGEPLALKTLRPALASDAELVRRFKQEMQTARRVTHRNVSRVFEFFGSDAGNGQSLAFLTMELLPGESLFERIRREGPIPAAEALPIVEQIVNGLAAAHAAGILHRDLKSSNILLVPETPDATRAVITDFGLACAAGGASDADVRGVAGTLAYAAPEQLAGLATTTASDIYSFGVVLFEMRTGRLPFLPATLAEAIELRALPPPAPHQFAEDVDAQWESVILACIDRDPARRPVSAQEVLKRLKSNVRTRRRWIVGAVLTASLAGGGWFATRPKQIDPEALKSFRRGKDFAQRRNEQGLRNAISEFLQAVKIEPRFAEAWIGIADAYSAMANFGFMEPRQALTAAREAASKALSLQGDSGRAAGVMGYVISLDVENWRQAQPYLTRAVSAEPKDPTIRLWYAAHLAKLGRFDEGIHQLKIGLDLDPMSLVLNQQLASEYFRSRRFSDYYTQALELVRLQPFEASSHLALARALEWQGRYPEALAACAEAQKLSASITSLCFRGTIEAAMGDLAAARRDAAEVRAFWSTHPFQSMLLASLYARIGEIGETLAVLNQGFDRGDSTVLIASVNPYFDALKDHAGFRQFLRRTGR